MKPGRRATLRALLAAATGAWPAARATPPAAPPARRAAPQPAVVLRGADAVVVVVGAPAPGAHPPPPTRLVVPPRPRAAAGLAVAGTGIWLPTAEPGIGYWPVAADGTAALAPAFRHGLPSPIHALACSPDGRWAFAGAAGQLHLVDRTGDDGLVHAGTDLAGRFTDHVHGLRALPHRRSLLVDWGRVGEWWEVSLDPAAPPIFDGLVHDYRMGEAIARPGYRHPRRIPLATGGHAAPRLVAAPPGQPWALGLDGSELVVVHLDVRRAIVRTGVGSTVLPWAVVAPPRPAAAARLWLVAGTRLLALTPARWGDVQLHESAPGLRALALAPAGDALWALADAPQGSRLLQRPLDADDAQPWRLVTAAPPGISRLVVDGGRAVAALAPAGAEGLDVVWFDADGSPAAHRHVTGVGPVLEAEVVAAG